jgi:histidine triad (HIT) family protein
MEECIFCKIAVKEAQAEIVYEDEEFVAFEDMHPKAPTHILVIPKSHLATLQDAAESDRGLLGGLLLAAQKVAKEKELKGYKLKMHVGKEGQHEINHIHLHLLAN